MIDDRQSKKWQTLENRIFRCHVCHASHRGAESGKAQLVIRTFEPAPHISLETESFVQSCLSRFSGMSKFWIKECLC